MKHLDIPDGPKDHLLQMIYVKGLDGRMLASIEIATLLSHAESAGVTNRIHLQV